MRIKGMALLFVLLAATACRGAKQAPAPTPDIDREDLLGAVLDQDAVGEDWDEKDNPGPNTVQIGGRVGAANIHPLLAEATSAFQRKEESGFVSNSVLLLRSEDAARSVITAHEEAAGTSSWTQDRDDGGRTQFSFSGAVQQLPSLGDSMFAARLKAVITTAADDTTEHSVEYVVFTVGPIVAFVVTQDSAASPPARRLESRVARLQS
jgi:hypothetical protein